MSTISNTFARLNYLMLFNRNQSNPTYFCRLNVKLLFIKEKEIYIDLILQPNK